MKVDSTDKLDINVFRCETLLTMFGAFVLYNYKYNEKFKNIIDVAMGDEKDEDGSWRTGLRLVPTAIDFLDAYLEPNDLAPQMGGGEK